MSPVITLMLAVAVLNEPITVVDAISTALVMAGVAWFSFADSRRAKPLATAASIGAKVGP